MELNSPADKEVSALVESNNPSDIDLGCLENPKFPSVNAGFILGSLLPEGTSISTSAVLQSISP